MSKRIINEIDKFITFCNSNKKKFQQEHTVRKNLKEFVEKKITQEKRDDNIGVKSYQCIEDTIEKGIAYQSDSCEEDNLEDIEDVDCPNKLREEQIKQYDSIFDKIIIAELNK